jgi:pilus assembly protein CpaE
VIVAANKVQQGAAEISKADFEASIERKVDFQIPYDIKASANAAKLGQTFANANRTSKASATIVEIGKSVIEVGETEAHSTGTAKKSLLGKLDLKAVLPKKKAKTAAEAAS